jgi:GNAT superfamily N-acetyltransferase
MDDKSSATDAAGLIDGMVLSDPDRGVVVRLAQAGDEGFILAMIRGLAEYEHSLHEVTATAAQLRERLFVDKVAECLIVSLDGVDQGIALFFRNFSTWEAEPGLFLEDLYVQQQARGHGLGIALLKALATVARERCYSRIEWSCLDWNEPSLRFYAALGAKARRDWVPHRLDQAGIDRLLN